jgi:hypothetical protein
MPASNGSTRVEKVLLLVPRWLVIADAIRFTGNLLAQSYDPISPRIYDPLTQVFTRCDRRSSTRAPRILDSFRKVYQAAERSGGGLTSEAALNKGRLW